MSFAESAMVNLTWRHKNLQLFQLIDYRGVQVMLVANVDLFDSVI